MLEGRNFIGIELNKDSKLFKKEDIDFIEVTENRLQDYFEEVSKKNLKYLAEKNIVKKMEDSLE